MILAIDSAPTSGWAYCHTQGHTHYWVCGTTKGKFAPCRKQVLENAKAAGCTHIVCEAAFLGLNPKTYAELIEVRCGWEFDAQAAGLRVIPAIMPAAWQSKMLVVNGASPKPGETKQWSMFIAKSLGATCATDHEADAVCIAEYARCVGADL